MWGLLAELIRALVSQKVHPDSGGQVRPLPEAERWVHLHGVVVELLSLICTEVRSPSATTVEGVFRISGSTRRMKELQDIFDRPPSYGKDVVWGPWSVHDAASVLRRYLNQMPEPVVPAELYDDFRNALREWHRTITFSTCVLPLTPIM